MTIKLNFFLVLLLALVGCGKTDEPKVTEPWVRLPPPNMQMTAAYLHIENTTAKPVTLVSATSPSIKLIEMHKTESKNGVATMVEQEQVVVPPKQTVSFEPGGLHFMFIGFHQDLREEQPVELTLNWSDGTSSVVSARVLRGQP